MVNVASLELCKELYGLSKIYASSEWDDTHLYWVETGNKSIPYELNTPVMAGDDSYPAYDAGYLLRKLQITADWTHGRFDLEHCCEDGSYKWVASYNSYNNDMPIGESDTPENALCKLAIELWKNGVLK